MVVTATTIMDSFGKQQMNEEKRRKRGKPKTRGKKTLEFDANELEVFHTLQGTSVNPQASMLLVHKIMK